MPRKPIPDRWTDYTCCNSTVANTRIIPLKTPLYDFAFKGNSYLQRWTPEDVVRTIPNIGLVINVCYARNPYYDVRKFEELGVEYTWLPCPGHEVPPPTIVEEFKYCVENFLSDEGNYSRLIGVHCTHGVNRTGYLVCHYLINSLGLDPSVAVQEFAAARGHEIERENYIEALNNNVHEL